MTTPQSILEQLALQAMRLGADMLEVEYSDGCEEVTAIKGDTGLGIANLRSSSPEAEQLRGELEELRKRRRRVVVFDACEYELRARTYESFGEQAYRVKLQRVSSRSTTRPAKTQ